MIPELWSSSPDGRVRVLSRSYVTPRPSDVHIDTSIK